MLSAIIMTVLLNGCAKNKDENNKIPFLPISQNNVLYIGLYGYSQEGNHSNNREATDDEETKIINWLNKIDKYDKKIEIPNSGNRKPDPSNIQVFTKDTTGNDNRNFMYILEKDNDSILISRPQSGVGYIVKHPELNKILKQLRQ